MPIALLVGGWFASAVIPRVVDKARNYLTSNYDLHNSTVELVETLTSSLLNIRTTIDVAERNMMINNPSLITWLRMLKETAYEAEDVLDNFDAREIRIKINKGKNKVSNFASSSLSTIKNMFGPDDDLKKLKKIVTKLQQLSADISNFANLVSLNNKGVIEGSESSQRRETISRLSDDMTLFGRDNELEYILEVILDMAKKVGSSKNEGNSSFDNRGLIVLPIAGIGGVGKTALAQVIFNNTDVQETFLALRAWVHASGSSNNKVLVQKIVQTFGGYVDLGEVTLEYVMKRLSATIDRRRFFIVLDDVSDDLEDQWDMLHMSLSCGAPRSVVLITTQNLKFANRIGTLSPIILDVLEPEEFSELFNRHAFGDKVLNETKRRNLESIGTVIGEKLHGLPLAAKVIGEILRSDLDEDQWIKVSKSDWWDIPEGEKGILPSLGLGYQHLNPELRQCFAYCSIFPRNFLFQKIRLVQIWAALDFIPNDSRGVKRLEEIGGEWFDKLVDKSFFLKTWDNKNYVMHDLMRDLAVAVSSDECFLFTEQSEDIPKGVRHLALETDNPEIVRGICKFKHLRTLLYFGHCEVEGMGAAIDDTLRMLNSIRVLDLSHMNMHSEDPPKSIEGLSHLRFLDLSSTGIEMFNGSFEHYHLQTLYLRECQFTSLPRGINKLINLRHLYASKETINLVNGIGDLTNLQELNEFRVGTTERRGITELKNMREITGQIDIFNLGNIRNRKEATQANLAHKKHLDNLGLYWGSAIREPNTCKEIHEGLKPHENIKQLNINGYKDVLFPDWMSQTSNLYNLRTLEIRGCRNIVALPPLGRLPFLDYMFLGDLCSLTRVGDDQFYGNSEVVFPSLNRIDFDSLPIWKDWLSQASARQFFPNLSIIYIRLARALKETPLLYFGATLRELHISGSDNYDSLPRCLSSLTSLTLLQLTDLTMRISICFRSLKSLSYLGLWDCPEIYSEEESLQSLPNLKKLHISKCPNLFSNYFTGQQTKGKGLENVHGDGLQSLYSIDIDDSIAHQNYHLIFGRLSSLQILNYKKSKLARFTANQDAWFQELSSLRELNFHNCDFEFLPNRLATLLTLLKLTFTSRPMIKCLPDNRMPPSLLDFRISMCSPDLTHRCQPEQGADWPKISHIPYIRINEKTVQMKDN